LYELRDNGAKCCLLCFVLLASHCIVPRQYIQHVMFSSEKTRDKGRMHTYAQIGERKKESRKKKSSKMIREYEQKESALTALFSVEKERKEGPKEYKAIL
jgi:hypothetical protein